MTLNEFVMLKSVGMGHSLNLCEFGSGHVLFFKKISILSVEYEVIPTDLRPWSPSFFLIDYFSMPKLIIYTNRMAL